MKPYLGQKAELLPGTSLIVESNSPDSKRGVVFEDDRETGYFYARDFSDESELFVDALHIYGVGENNRGILVQLRIIWTLDWMKSALLIDNVPHAMFDFSMRIGYSKDSFPKPNPKTGWKHAEWKSELRDLFYS